MVIIKCVINNKSSLLLINNSTKLINYFSYKKID